MPGDPDVPQDGFGWPGGLVFVQTTIWYFGFGIGLLLSGELVVGTVCGMATEI